MSLTSESYELVQVLFSRLTTAFDASSFWRSCLIYNNDRVKGIAAALRSLLLSRKV
jgi:hypothetical protein